MRNVLRHDPAGRPVFITQVCNRREPLLSGRESALLAIIAEVRVLQSAKVYAHVVMPDHFRLLLDVPGGFSAFMRSVKLRAVRRWRRPLLWQERFYDHVVRDERDLRNHLDYIHYNPVRHGQARVPEQFAWSSFRRYQKAGWYPVGWGHIEPDNLADLRE